jgi:DNA-binding NarL/FixJ family response regulator
MCKIKVLLAVRPRLLSAVVRHLVERQPDMAMVSEASDPGELGSAIRATAAEVVIITPADSDRESGIGNDLLTEYPQLKIMALSTKGDTALVYEAGLPKKRIDEVSEESILSAIREFRC